MKKTTLSLIRTIRLVPVLVLATTALHAQQLKLGDNPAVIQKSAVLELESKTQGLLLPRISDTTSLTMSTAPNGMIIFLTADNTFRVRTNGIWAKMAFVNGVAGGDLTGNYPNPVIANGVVTGAKMAQNGAATGQILKWNGTTWAPAADDNTFTSLSMTVPAQFTVSPATLNGNGTFTIGLQSETANTIFAAPNGTNGTPAFRSLLAADIPTLPFSKISGTVPVSQGGTGLTAVGAAGTVLTSNGTSLTYSAMPSATLTLTGDVGGTGSGTIGTTIANQAVTFAKMQNIGTQRLIGRYAGGTGSPQEVSMDATLKIFPFGGGGFLYVDSTLALYNASRLQGRPLSVNTPTTGQVLQWDGSNWTPANQNAGSMPMNGDVTSGTPSGGFLPVTINNQAVTFAKMQNIGTQRLMGRYSNGVGSPQEVAMDATLKFTTNGGNGFLYVDSTLAIYNASKVEGMKVSGKTPNTGEVLKWNGSAWETNTDNDGGASFAQMPDNDISKADVAGTPAPPMKVWASLVTGTVTNGPLGTSASSWNVMSFRGGGFTTQLYFDKNTMAVKEWGGNTSPLTDNAASKGNYWYKAIVTNGDNVITDGSILFGKKSSDASSEVGQDNANLFYDNANKRLGVGTNTPNATLDVNGSVSTNIRVNPGGGNVQATDYTIIKTNQSTTTYTLPSSSSSAGRILIFKVSPNASGTGGNAPRITVDAAGSDNIDSNGGNLTLTKGQRVTLQSDGNGTWWILAQ